MRSWDSCAQRSWLTAAAPEDGSGDGRGRAPPRERAAARGGTPEEALPPVTPPIAVTACVPGYPPVGKVKDHAFCGAYTDGCGNIETAQCPKGSNTYCVENACYPIPTNGGACLGKCPDGTECDPATLSCVRIGL